MSIEIADIDKQFKTVTLKVLKKYINSWLFSHQKKLLLFENLTQKLAAELEYNLTNNLPKEQIWIKLHQTFEAYLNWSSELKYSESGIFDEAFFEKLNAELAVKIEEFPKKVKFLIDDTFLAAESGDSAALRFWKWLYRRRKKLILLNNNFKNKIRAIFRQKKITAKKLNRQVQIRDFLYQYALMPCAQFLMKEWQQFLKEAATQLFHLHAQSELIKNETLFCEQSDSHCLLFEEQHLLQLLDKLKQNLGHFDSYLKHFENYEKTVQQRFSEFWTQNLSIVEKKLDHAGTTLLPNSSYNNSQFKKNLARLDTRFVKINQAWKTHFDGEFEDWQKDIELALLQLATVHNFLTTINLTETQINKNILPALDSVGSDVTNSLQQINGANFNNKAAIRQAIQNNKKSLIEILRNEKLPEVMDVLVAAQVDQILKQFYTKLKSGVDSFPKEHVILKNRDLQNLIPNSKVDNVPFRVLVEEEILPAAKIKFDLLVKEIFENLEELFRDISEIDQLVEYNFESALNMLKEEEETDVKSKSLAVAVEGLERVSQKVEVLKEKNHKIQAKIKENLIIVTFEFIKRIQELEDNERILILKLRFARTKTREKIRDFYVRSWRKCKLYFLHSLNVFNKLSRLISHVYSRFRKISGLTATEAEVEIKLTQFLTSIRHSIDSLPYIYQRLFRIEPLTDERFFSGRTNELNELENVFNEWHNGQYAVTALVGEKGSGRTTLINFAESQFLKNLPNYKINLFETTISTEDELLHLLKDTFRQKRVKNLDQLENKLAESEEPKICVVENIQNMFLRTVNGFDALERFLLFVSLTDHKIYWLLTCTLYSWKYLDNVLGISKFFRIIINLSSLPKEEVENIILKRHRISGYILNFSIPEKIARSKKFKKLSDQEKQQEYLRNNYFNQLHEFASGNVTVAMMFWLSAIKEISENKMILSPTIDIDYSFLFQSPADELFTLMSLLQHETLCPEEHAAIFNQDIQDSLLLLNRMKNKRIIVEVRKRYQIHHLLYRPVVAVLKAKNIIY